ncbi:hypothetical protein WJX73_000750 [Symbiochloris irregularis]|uniref:Uncharacterized protein n=1 Tax=Symbiochloris irregularis TaxID=706552 RepID=A0AAW1NQ84_9CHLO
MAPAQQVSALPVDAASSACASAHTAKEPHTTPKHLDAPRIHGIDDYFVTEVEKEVSSADGKGRKQRMREMEYCFEPELEGCYKQSLLKAYSRTVEEGRFKVVIVDAPNVRVEDFKDYWGTGQRAGYEVFVMQPVLSDPQACFERNIHSRTLEDIQSMAQVWEQPPLAYPQVDFAPLLQPSSSEAKEDIAEVNMESDAEEEAMQGKPNSTRASEEGSTPTASAPTSRWADTEGDAQDSEPVQKRRKVKKAAKGNLPDQALKVKKPILKTRTGSSGILKGRQRKGVSWPDESSSAAAGFSMTQQKLETVYVLEGLGPPRSETSTAAPQGPSFADQAKKDRNSEQQLFRSMMLGGARLLVQARHTCTPSGAGCILHAR